MLEGWVLEVGRVRVRGDSRNVSNSRGTPVERRPQYRADRAVTCTEFVCARRTLGLSVSRALYPRVFLSHFLPLSFSVH